MSDLLFVITAPSGAGKSTIVNSLRSRVEALGYSISHTSRESRGEEKDGVSYHFVDRDTFKKMIEAGEFVEWAEVYHNFYGTSFSSLDEQTALGSDVLLDLDAQGAKNIKEHFENSVLIYVLPPSLDILEKRLRERRTDDEDVIKARTKRAADEIKECAWYDYIVINDNFEKAIGEVQSIIKSERCRTNVQLPKVKHLFDIPTP